MQLDKRVLQVDSKIITAFELFFSEEERQRILWPSSIRLSHEYFSSLQEHAVPLDERALAGLAHSAMSLDTYAWLAQRLHRVPPGRPQFIAWAALREQFGAEFVRMDHFKGKFRVALGQVLAFYPAAKVKGDGRGLTLYNSAPAVRCVGEFTGSWGEKGKFLDTGGGAEESETEALHAPARCG